jgi:hypothetical protein
MVSFMTALCQRCNRNALLSIIVAILFVMLLRRQDATAHTMLYVVKPKEAGGLTVHGPSPSPSAVPPKPGRHVLMSSVASSIGWQMPDCNTPVEKAQGLISDIANYPDIDYVIIADNCESKNVTNQVTQITSLLPNVPNGASKEIWWSKGKWLGYRFLEFYEYIRLHDEIDYVVLADAWDVRLTANPFDMMMNEEQFTLFIQAEWRTHVQSLYMQERLVACLPENMYKQWQQLPILNCGVMGGTRQSVLSVLKKMMELYYLVLSQYGKEECFPLGVDMAVYNHVLYVQLEMQLKQQMRVNEPFCPVFRNCPYIYHVTHSATVPNTSSIPCQQQPHPVMMDASYTMTQADDYARQVCTGGPPPHVYCDALPFVLIHKGSVEWNA